MQRSFAITALALGLVFTGSAAYAQDGPGRGERDKSIGDTTRACWGKRCNGQDPISKHCNNDAQSIIRYDTSLGLLELRHSPACGASWARITGARAGTWFYVQACYAPYTQTFRVPRGYTDAYTDMVPGQMGIRVGNLADHSPCFQPSDAKHG
ncbi:DUF2690 domain-containing protein [Nonomuraea sp. NPDC050227]|uniref:DUF2690 domain-containing protein n=1 Tax=unclassified Nonomuraea TaxID=2593643 RepID=UPI0033DBB620